MTITGPDPPSIVACQDVTLRFCNNAGEILRASGVARAEGRHPEQDFFVTSRGGEYFFVPSISTIRLIARGHGRGR